MTGDTTPISDEAAGKLLAAVVEVVKARGLSIDDANAVIAAAAPLLVSAEAERRGADEVNRLRRLSYNDGYNDGYATVEGLRAELAERDAKIRGIVAAIHAEIRDPYAAAVAPSICTAVDEAVEVIETAALRAAGGQEKPNDDRFEIRDGIECTPEEAAEDDYIDHIGIALPEHRAQLKALMRAAWQRGFDDNKAEVESAHGLIRALLGRSAAFHEPPEGWMTFGSHAGRGEGCPQIEFSPELDDVGEPLWERCILVAPVGGQESATVQIEALAQRKAIAAHALGRGDEERGWLDVLAIIERAAPVGGQATEMCSSCGGSGIGPTGDPDSTCYECGGSGDAKPERTEQPAGHGLNALCIVDGCDVHPVGGQAEPSDASNALARVTAWLDDDEALRIPDTEWGGQLYDDLRVVLAAAAVSGEQAQPDGETR